MRMPWMRDDGAEEEPGDAEGARARFVEVADEAALAAVFERSGSHPTVLFLHDPWCPISSYAYEEVERVDAEVFMVDVSTGRALSRAIQAATGVRHESPQAFVLVDGRPAWHASHGRVRAAALREVLGARGEA